MGGDTHAALVVRVGSSRLGPRLPIQVTIKTIVADLEIQPPTSKAASDAEVPTVPVIVDCTDFGVAILVKNVGKCLVLWARFKKKSTLGVLDVGS